MKKNVGVMLGALFFALSTLLVSCSDVGTKLEQLNTVIPADKTGVVISNPFKDSTRFDARTIIYYSKHDVDFYQISVWYLGALDKEDVSDTTMTDDNMISTLKISKEDSYTSKTMVFDNEGTYYFKCTAYCGEEVIAEDSASKQLSFATAEFVIFYLVPKIKTQTADVGVSISWVGDDESSPVHTIRFVRPVDKLDTTIKLLANGKVDYNENDFFPYAFGKIPLSKIDFSLLVGKVGDSYSFSLTTSVKEDYQEDIGFSDTLFSWIKTYSSSNTVISDNFSGEGNFLTSGSIDSSLWILLDSKIDKTINTGGYVNEPCTIEELQSKYIRLDSKGNVYTLGDYIKSECSAVSYSPEPDTELVGYIGDFSETIWEVPNCTCTEDGQAWHYAYFKAIKTPYEF